MSKTKFYARARVFIETAKSDARALRLPACPYVDTLPLSQISRHTALYYRVYWSTLKKEQPREAVDRIAPDVQYRAMGNYERLARDVDELRATLARIEKRI